jgi:hypothetical protein
VGSGQLPGKRQARPLQGRTPSYFQEAPGAGRECYCDGADQGRELGTSLVEAKPTFSAELTAAKAVLVKETITIKGSSKTLLRHLPIVH